VLAHLWSGSFHRLAAYHSVIPTSDSDVITCRHLVHSSTAGSTSSQQQLQPKLHFSFGIADRPLSVPSADLEETIQMRGRLHACREKGRHSNSVRSYGFSCMVYMVMVWVSHAVCIGIIFFIPKQSSGVQLRNSFVFASHLCLSPSWLVVYTKSLPGSFRSLSRSFHVRNRVCFIDFLSLPQNHRRGNTSKRLEVAQMCPNCEVLHRKSEIYTRWPKKVSHYKESSSNRVKKRHWG